MSFLKKLLLLNAGALTLASLTTLACACGCELITPGTESMFPKAAGGLAYVKYDYQNQNRNRHGASRAPADDNEDKDIRTHTVTAGVRYMFNGSWGAQIDVPYVNRSFTVDDGSGTGTTATATYASPGDIRLSGIYTGLSDDMSTGLTFGVKLPTGDFKATDESVDIDRDTQIGTGSTDVLLGAFHRGDIGDAESDWKWFAQLQSDLPVLVQNGYRPGFQFDASAGISYHGVKIGGVTVAPVAQIIGTVKTRDHGGSAHSPDTGYERLLLAPGIEVTAGSLVVFADVELPVADRVNGNQLASESIARVMVGYKF